MNEEMKKLLTTILDSWKKEDPTYEPHRIYGFFADGTALVEDEEGASYWVAVRGNEFALGYENKGGVLFKTSREFMIAMNCLSLGKAVGLNEWHKNKKTLRRAN